MATLRRMKRLFFFLLLVLAAGRLPAHAEGPDDQYIQIYGLIQAGDKLAASEPASAALPTASRQVLASKPSST